MREAMRRCLVRRTAIGAAVSIASVIAFASLVGLGLARSTVAPTPSGKKVTICHKGKHTITISIRAWPAHQRHGETLGACATAQGTGSTTGASTESSTTGPTSHGNGNGGGNGNGKGKGHG